MRALVLGAAGQDGRLLTAILRGRGHEVIGIARRPIEHEPEIVIGDLRDGEELTRHLDRVRPDVIFHLAAVHGSAGTGYETVWRDMLAVNVGSVHAVLEHLRTRDPQARLVYASSAKVFRQPFSGRIDETSPLAPACLYGIAKMTAGQAIQFYRRKHGLKAGSLYLFNHESPLRPAEFFIPKLVAVLAGAIADRSHVGRVQTLEFWTDWGSASEYMEIAAELGEGEVAEDYVLGTGWCIHARALAEGLFRRFDLDYRNHVTETAPEPPSPAPEYVVATDRLRCRLGRVPTETIENICLNILRVNYGIG